MKHSVRCPITGQFMPKPKKAINIVAGRLYGYRGAVVRAGNDVMRRDNQLIQRHVSFHKALFGFVPESELEIIDKKQVEKYLEKAKTTS